MNTEELQKNRDRALPVKKGFLFMIAACAVYLIWWFVNYYPDSPFSGFLGNPVGMAIWVSMFAAVAVLCIAAAVLFARGFKELKRDQHLLSAKGAVLACLAASVLLPLLIGRIRFITLDIFLIIWWAFLELYSANALFGAHLMEEKTARHSVTRTLVYTGICLSLYIIYPFPPEYVRFWLGSIPIFLYAIDMAWMVKQIEKSQRRSS